MDYRVTEAGFALTDSEIVPCALGRGGIQPTKREGDGVTPVGDWPIRRVLYRPDRVDTPETALPVRPIAPDDGWCDAPADTNYNRPVKKPYPASHEDLWREDHLYDIIVILGHNDDPPVPHAGSAIFLHVAKPDFGPTEGCVALPLETLQRFLRTCRPGDRLSVRPEKPQAE